MNIYKNLIKAIVPFILVLSFNSCQDIDYPELGDYPTDVANIPDGPLRFYIPFDGTEDLLKYQFKEELSGYPCFTPDNSITSETGINQNSFKAGNNGTFLKYLNPNDFPEKAQSFTVSFWEKRNGQTKNNTNNNGPEYPFSFTTKSGYHWSGSNFFLLFEGNNDACAVKFVIASGLSSGNTSTSDTWLTWEDSNSVSGLLDNEWHHCVFVYDASTSGLTFYKDGVAVSTRTWDSHGNIGLEQSVVTSLRIGCGPANDFNSNDWLSSSWKGSLDQFRMYASALTQAEITDLYTNHK